MWLILPEVYAPLTAQGDSAGRRTLRLRDLGRCHYTARKNQSYATIPTTVTTNSRKPQKKYLTYQEQADFFKNEFLVSVEGYGPHSKLIMYPIKIVYKIPEQITDSLGLERLLYRLLRSKRYLKNGRSYVMFCKKK